MKRYRTIAWLVNVATVLVAWHGILLSLPHTHHDNDVPRYAAVCEATRAGSSVVHLHPAPGLIPPHGCLACLVSSVHGTPVSWHESVAFHAAVAIRTVRVNCRRADSYRDLPSLRAPPSMA